MIVVHLPLVVSGELSNLAAGSGLGDELDGYAGCGGDGVVVGNKKSGRQQKRTLEASWDIQLGAKPRYAAKCGAYYQRGDYC